MTFDGESFLIGVVSASLASLYPLFGAPAWVVPVGLASSAITIIIMEGGKP